MGPVNCPSPICSAVLPSTSVGDHFLNNHSYILIESPVWRGNILLNFNRFDLGGRWEVPNGKCEMKVLQCEGFSFLVMTCTVASSLRICAYKLTAPEKNIPFRLEIGRFLKRCTRAYCIFQTSSGSPSPSRAGKLANASWRPMSSHLRGSKNRGCPFLGLVGSWPDQTSSRGSASGTGYSTVRPYQWRLDWP